MWSASSASSSPTTQTSSGASAPNVSGRSAQGVGAGSIGVSGTGAKYQEQGSLDLSGSKGSAVGGTVGTISAGPGASVILGDPNALNQVSALAQQFADAVSGVASQTPAAVQTALAGQPNAPAASNLLGLNISTNMVYLAIAILGSILAWLFISKKK
ncbi:MAG: hypothetical protein ABSA45_03195 [Verrucomicrobiota bacterium]|jgi:hypothetical protein